MGNAFQRQLKSYGHLGPGLKPLSKSPRKFAEFSAGEEVVMGRATAPTLTVSQSHHANLESASTQVVTPRDYLPPVKTSSSMDSISTSAGLPKNQSPKDEVTPSKLQHPSTFPNSKSLSTPLQQPENSESDASASNWRQALLSGCVVGVAAVAVLTGYACCTVIRGAVNVGQFIYENRENIQQTCTTCTQAVQSTYNAAKRRMVSVPRLPVGVRRRYAPSPQSQGRSRQYHSFWQRRKPKQSSHSPYAIASALPSNGMEGVEYSVVSEVPSIPNCVDTVTSDSCLTPPNSHDLASELPRMTAALYMEPSSGSVPRQPAKSSLSGPLIPFEIEPMEDRMGWYAKPIVSQYLDDDETVPALEGKGVNEGVNMVAELFSRDGGQINSACVEVDRDLPLPGKFPNEPSGSLNDPQARMASPGYHSRPGQTASFAATRLMEELEEMISPHVTFYESPRTGRPVNRIKKYIKDEPMDFPVEDSTLNASPAIGSIESPTQQEQDAEGSKTDGTVRGRTTPYIAPTVSGLRGSRQAKGRRRKAGLGNIGTKIPQGEQAGESAEGARLVPKSLSIATRHKRQNLPRAQNRP